METTKTTAPPHHSARTELKTLLDELRVKMHLGKMEVKDAFQEISREAQKLGRVAEHEAERRAAKLVDRVRSVVESLGDSGD